MERFQSEATVHRSCHRRRSVLVSLEEVRNFLSHIVSSIFFQVPSSHSLTVVFRRIQELDNYLKILIEGGVLIFIQTTHVDCKIGIWFQ